MIPVAELGLDPDVEQVLLDIAKDENSTLFRVPPHKLHRYAATGGPADLTGLSTAERHLMQTHRVEVARALRDVCRARLWGHKTLRLHAIKEVTPTRLAQKLSTPEAHAHARVAIGQANDCGASTSLESALMRCLGGPSKGWPTISEIAATSLRLAPSGAARVHAALAEQYEGRSAGAIPILEAVLSGSPSNTIRVSALTNLGFAYSQLGDARTAHLAYGEATSLDPERIMPAVSKLVVSVFLLDRKEACRSASIVSDLLTADHSAVESFSAMQAGHRLVGMMRTPRPITDMSKELLSMTHGSARRILEVLA